MQTRLGPDRRVLLASTGQHLSSGHQPTAGRFPDSVPVGVRAALVTAIILVTLAAIWWEAVPTGLISCARDCGEVFVARQYIDNYQLYGLRYGLVEDMATSPDLSAHPYLYPHNVNVAGLSVTLLELLGARPFWMKQLVTALGFGFGLAYVYRATAYLSRSWLAGLVTLLFFVTDVGQVLPFGLNALRAWHWLALFGLLFHLGRLTRKAYAGQWLDRVAVAGFATLAFGLGYDFWVICGFLAGATVLLWSPRPRSLWQIMWLLAFVALVFAVPFVLRQIQMVLVLGPAFWLADVIYSAAIKVSVLSRLVPLPSQAELDAIYRAAGVVRAPAQPTESWAAIWGTFREMAYHLLLPDVGLVALALTVLVTVMAVVGVLVLAVCPSRRFVRMLHWAGVRGQERRMLIGACLLVTVLAFAVVAGLAFFAPLSLHIYLKHRFPLVAAPILVVKGLLVAALITWFARSRLTAPRTASAAMLVAVLLVADHGIVQTRVARAATSMSLAWMDDVAVRRDASFAVSYVANAVTPYTSAWAVGVPPGREREIAARIEAGRLPFDLEDYLLFGMQDAAAREEEYRRPDFWLYFPTEQLAPFDSPAPSCRTDYLLQAVQRLRLGAEPVPRLRGEFWVQRPSVRPGDLVRIGGQITGFGDTPSRAELLMDGVPVGSLNVDCLRARFLGEYRVPPDTPPGEYLFSARLIAPDGRVTPMGEARIQVFAGAQPAAPFLFGAQAPQPTPSELEALLPDVPVAARGDGYVIFDLRDVYPRLR
ncbi:MAG: hypothetical protein AB7K36_02625 [Chloroflexota bacterium]